MTRPAPLPVEDVIAQPERARASISPDGTRIAFLAPWRNRLNVWVAGVDEPLDDARCVTADEDRDIREYHWASERWLLYTQDLGGDENAHVYRVDLGRPGSAAVDLTPFPGARVFAHDLPPGRPGTLVVLVNHRRPDQIDLCAIDIATGDLRVLTEGGADDLGVLVGPDGGIVGLTQDDDADWQITHRPPGAAPSRVVATLQAADHPVGPHPLALTPDGTGVWVGRHGDTDRLRLVRIDLATGDETEVAGHPSYDLDTRAQVFPQLPSPLILDARGELLGVRYSRERQVVVPVTPHFAEVLERLEALSDGDLGAVSVDVSGQRWVVTFVHDRDPGVTWFYDHATGDARVLFRPFPQRDPAAAAPITPVTITARDGLALPSYLTLPVLERDAGAPRPMVLMPHGGPWTRDAWGYDPVVQLFADRGYAVLQVNFRGSTGFGRAHMQAGIGELARRMHDDLVDGVEWAVTHGHADPSRIAILGGSYGGYAALVAVTQTPHLFAAAVDYVGISNLVTFMQALPEVLRPGLRSNWYAYAGDPNDPEQVPDLLERSPLTHADRIVTPLLVSQGANDVRVPQSESDAIVASLRGRGVEVGYRVYDDEGHLFSQPENLVDMFTTVDRFFAEHLGGAGGGGA
ncbi:S9 family peptidase [Actinomycetospora cinnamomea]|uniref:Dipeptidyl aminopeptidase/acylaminoacyl peptidase n=1 Tax=Actinomycetospora cinnamomea TaxID=663609 RepID=A0A2U1EBK7_9PSEU|nr:S9 family peptidase [Actinomycetospora cinnamomea]PVY97265.1 dipeptidyl aminopeptidase/acylaminoacyl peptidase [Actinomycetospora cinnamomea]